MAITIRMYLRGRRGRCLENYRARTITSRSVVHISVSEATDLEPRTFTPVFSRFVGAANISVHNVSPSDGRVDFVVMVNWNRPLNIVTDITIMDDPVEFVLGQ